jgi:hypothetical protein
MSHVGNADISDYDFPNTNSEIAYWLNLQGLLLPHDSAAENIILVKAKIY